MFPITMIMITLHIRIYYLRCLIGAIIAFHESHRRLIGHILVFDNGLKHRLDFCELLLDSLLVRHDELAVRRHRLIQPQYRRLNTVDLVQRFVLRVVSAFTLSQWAARLS